MKIEFYQVIDACDEENNLLKQFFETYNIVLEANSYYKKTVESLKNLFTKENDIRNHALIATKAKYGNYANISLNIENGNYKNLYFEIWETFESSGIKNNFISFSDIIKYKK